MTNNNDTPDLRPVSHLAQQRRQWHITCPIPGHHLDDGFRFDFERDSNNEEIFKLRAVDANEFFHDTLWIYKNGDQGIFVCDTEAEFLKMFPCDGSKVAKAGILHASRAVECAHMSLKNVTLPNGQEHDVIAREVYIRECKAARLAISLMPGPNHPIGKLHAGVAHGDPD